MPRDPAAWVAGLADAELHRVARTYRRLYEAAVLDAAEREAAARGLQLEPLPAEAEADSRGELPAVLQLLSFAAVGALVAGQFAYSMRPVVPGTARQLPWRTVLMRATDLHDPAPLVVLLARVSFDYVALGSAVGALLGALAACLLALRRRRADSPARRLVRLAELRAAGHLSETEYRQRKAELMQRL